MWLVLDRPGSKERTVARRQPHRTPTPRNGAFVAKKCTNVGRQGACNEIKGTFGRCSAHGCKTKQIKPDLRLELRTFALQVSLPRAARVRKGGGARVLHLCHAAYPQRATPLAVSINLLIAMIQVEFSSQSSDVSATCISPALPKSFASSAASQSSEVRSAQFGTGTRQCRGKRTAAEVQELVARLGRDVVLVEPLEELPEALVHVLHLALGQGRGVAGSRLGVYSRQRRHDRLSSTTRGGQTRNASRLAANDGA